MIRWEDEKTVDIPLEEAFQEPRGGHASRGHASRIFTILQKVRKHISTAVKVIDLVNEIGEKPKLRNYMGSGLKVLDIGLDKLASKIAKTPGDWRHINYRSMFVEEMLMSLEQAASSVDEITSSGFYLVEKIFNVNDFRVRFLKKKDDTVFFSTEDGVSDEQFFSMIGRATWERLGSSITLTTERTTDGSSTPMIKLRQTTNKDSYPSEQARALLKRIQQFKKIGERRSIMLDGPPGTGKSSMMRHIAEQIDDLCLTVSVGEFKTMENDDVFFMVNILKPSVLLIDDFDRIYDDEAFLSELELINSVSSLFIVSVNDTDRLDRSVLRPGRFDEIEAVDKIDYDVIHELIPWADDELMRLVSDWPVAFIVELAKRKRALGVEKSGDVMSVEIEKLRKRVDMNSKKRTRHMGSA